jgi:hypothetical protein
VTLLIAVMARDFVMLASDRRLTYPDGRVVEDDRTKTVFAQGYGSAFAYTGLAELPVTDGIREAALGARLDPRPSRLPLNEWLCAAFAVHQRDAAAPVNVQMRGVADELLPAVRKLLYVLPDRRLRIVTVIGRLRHGGRRALADSLEGHERRAGRDHWRPVGGVSRPFQMGAKTLPSDSRLLIAVSKRLPVNMVEDLRRAAMQAARRRSPAWMSRVLVDFIRRVSTSGIDRTVGEGVLVTCIPRDVGNDIVHSRPFDMNGVEANLRTATFQYRPQGGDTPERRPPSVISTSGAQLIDVTLEGGCAGRLQLRLRAVGVHLAEFSERVAGNG